MNLRDLLQPNTLAGCRDKPDSATLPNMVLRYWRTRVLCCYDPTSKSVANVFVRKTSHKNDLPVGVRLAESIYVHDHKRPSFKDGRNRPLQIRLCRSATNNYTIQHNWYFVKKFFSYSFRHTALKATSRIRPQRSCTLRAYMLFDHTSRLPDYTRTTQDM